MEKEPIVNVFYFVAKYSISIFAILNPFGALPVLISLISDYSKVDRIYVVKKSSIYAGLILIFFVIFGNILFEIFGISLGAFQIAGGIILAFVAINMIFGQPYKERASTEEISHLNQKENIAIVPLAIPLLSGPGAISTVITIASTERNILYHIFLILSIIIACFGVYLILRAAEDIDRFLGKIGINVLSRLMGIILMALAVQFIIKGLHLAFSDILKFS
ncbi:MAG: MarC family protein [Hydrogenothermaceae bacterium]